MVWKLLKHSTGISLYTPLTQPKIPHFHHIEELSVWDPLESGGVGGWAW